MGTKGLIFNCMDKTIMFFKNIEFSKLLSAYKYIFVFI